jgi:hypothetical protein
MSNKTEACTCDSLKKPVEEKPFSGTNLWPGASEKTAGGH